MSARLQLVVAGLFALPGCYEGLHLPEAEAGGGPGPDSGAADDGTGDGGSGSDGGGDDGADDGVPLDFDPDPGQVRLLSSEEYKATIGDLLGVEASADLSFADLGSGFDNSAGNQLEENLFSILLVEAERIAQEYVANGLAADFPCFDPGSDASDTCVQSVVDELGSRAFRRPVDSDTREQLLAFAQEIGAGAQDSTQVMEFLVTRMLMSPRFLYRTEVGQPLDTDPSVARLDPFERASLISYSVVGSMPDDELFAAAEANELDEDGIRTHVRRLMASDRGRAQVVRFFQQYLRVGELEHMAAVPEDFPKFESPEQAQALNREFEEFVGRVVFDDGGTLADLLLQEVAYVNRHTAHLYGAVSTSDELERLELDADQRGGVLTLASVMAVHSSSAEVERDKPIRRGLLIKNQFLCETVGLPSGVDVQSAAEDVLDEVPNFDELTTREQLELIMNQDQACMDCHVTFMPYGYLWSNFDALGQYQTHFGDRALDPAVGELLLDEQVEAYGSIMEFLPELVGSTQVSSCFTTNVAQYTTGQTKSNLVEHLATQVEPVFVDNDRDILQLFEDILARPELYLRRGTP